MQTSIHKDFHDEPRIADAEAILRSCVHCGFCNATCPTYLDLGDERDGPRGRIYLVKQLLETAEAGRSTQQHLDRCLTCHSCETTCPSGVKYVELAHIGRELIERQVERPWTERMLRRLLRLTVPWPARFRALLAPARALRPVLPARLKSLVPPTQAAGPWPPARHARKVILLRGCAQSVVTPRTNAAAARVLDRIGISAIEADRAGCCGAMSQHLAAAEEARTFIRSNLDAWEPYLEAGAEAIVFCASGCGAMLRDYPRLMQDDPVYAPLARRAAAITLDLAEYLAGEDLAGLSPAPKERIALHCPCTLTHALRAQHKLRGVLERVGVDLVPTRDDHLCCGSAGTYSLLQPGMAARLRTRKLEALTVDAPDRIVTANVGCQLHLSADSSVPVAHWIELLDDFSRGR